MRRDDLGVAVRIERFELDVEQPVTGTPLYGKIRSALLAERLAEQAEEQAERMRIELTQVRKLHRSADGEAPARRLDLACLFGELERQTGAGLAAISHAGQRSAGCCLAILAQSGMNPERRGVGPRRAGRQLGVRIGVEGEMSCRMERESRPCAAR